MEQKKKQITNIPAIIKSLDEHEDEAFFLLQYNKMICMVTSLSLWVGSLFNFVIRYWFFHSKLSTILFDSFVLLLLALGFEIFMRTRIQYHPKAIHIISLLYLTVFVYILIRFYPIIGPSVWVIAFIQVIFSMAHGSPIMLRYIFVCLVLSSIYLLFSQGQEPYGVLYHVMLFAFLMLAIVVSSIVYSVIDMRKKKLIKQNQELKIQIEERIKVEKENRELSLFDQLTGLPNRSLFNEELNRALIFAKRNNYKVYILFLDLDMFKMVNDTMGHTMGDQLLVSVGKRISATLRKSDIMARIGGDEFLIMIKDVTNDIDIAKIAEKILLAIASPFNLDQHRINITLSIGISQFPADGNNVETLVKCADISMYKAKDEGKNCYAFYSATLKQVVENEMNLIHDLHDAIQKNEFVLYYQPLVNNITKEIIGFESLIRWNHPKLGLLLPKDFIEIAERSGLINSIGEWVLRTACSQNKTWQNEGYAHVPISVNISSNQIYNVVFLEELSAILKETKLDPSCLSLEFTERILIKDFKKAKRILNSIKQLGIKIAIDDFGTGYSSIYYLKQLPIDLIKIPMEFVHGINNNTKDESIISVILGLADNLNMEVIAEGVETQDQLEFLNNNLCNSIQGFYFYKPMDATDIIKNCQLYSNKKLTF